MMPLVKGDRYRVGRGHSIYDNINGEMWIVNDEDPAKIEQGFETCAVLVKSSKGKGWFVWDVDEGFRSQDKWLQDLVDEYNEFLSLTAAISKPAENMVGTGTLKSIGAGDYAILLDARNVTLLEEGFGE